MGRCIYCGEPAGLFRQSHEECEKNRASGLSEITDIICASMSGTGDMEQAKKAVTAKAKSSRISEDETRDSVIRTWEGFAYHFLDDGALEPIEEQRLLACKDTFGLTDRDLNQRGMLSRVQNARVLREVLVGEFPSTMPDVPLGAFNFQKSERPVWGFAQVDYHEDRTKRVSSGGSQGVSIRIARGLYYRIGNFKGESVSRTERLHVDTGVLAMTDRHLYFSGPRKSFRIRYDKIVSYSPFNDGFMIVREAAEAKPQIFRTGDGWFAFNLLVNLAQRDRPA